MNSIPIVGWLISLFFTASQAVPFWLIWTVFSIGEKYFSFLPAEYQSIPFWHCVGLFTVIAIAKPIITPQFVKVSQSNK